MPAALAPAASMTAAGRIEPWRCITDPSARLIELPATPAAHWRLVGEMRALPPGTTVLLSGTAPSSQARLGLLVKDARLQILSRHIVIPTLSPPTSYVADTPTATRYFVEHILAIPRGGGVAAAGLSAWRTLSAVGAHRALGLVARRRLILARTAPDGVGPPAPAGVLAVDGMDSITLAFSKDPNAKLTVLLLPRGARQPEFAVKVPTTEGAARVLQAEKRVLEGLRSQLPPGLAATVPRIAPLPEAPQGSMPTGAMRGVSMSTRYHEWRHLGSRSAVGDDFDVVERWLGAFQAATGGPVLQCDLAANLDDRLRQRFGEDANLSFALATLAEITGRLRKMHLPRVAVHGDFWFGNLLMDRGAITGVVDWESATLNGDPLRDPVRFALSYALYLDRHTRSGSTVSGHSGLVAGDWGAGIAYAFNGDGWFPELFRSFLERGLTRLGGDPHAWRDAALAGLVEIAATADHPEFARLHWDLFKRLAMT